MSSETVQETLTGGQIKEDCPSCKESVAPNRLAQSNRKYCPLCNVVWSDRERGRFDE